MLLKCIKKFNVLINLKNLTRKILTKVSEITFKDIRKV